MKAFLSYNRKDAAEAEALADRLRSAGVDIWMDKSDTTAGAAWLQELEHALTSAETTLVCIGAHGLGPVQDTEVQLALKFSVDDGAYRVIPVLLPGSGNEPQMPELLRLGAGSTSAPSKTAASFARCAMALPGVRAGRSSRAAN